MGDWTRDTDKPWKHPEKPKRTVTHLAPKVHAKLKQLAKRESKLHGRNVSMSDLLAQGAEMLTGVKGERIVKSSAEV